MHTAASSPIADAIVGGCACGRAGKDFECIEQGAKIDEHHGAKLTKKIKRIFLWQIDESDALVAELVKQLCDWQGVVKAEKLQRGDRQQATRIEKKRSPREQRERIRQLELALSMHKAQSSAHRAQLQYIEATKSGGAGGSTTGK